MTSETLPVPSMTALAVVEAVLRAWEVDAAATLVPPSADGPQETPT